MTQFIRIAVRNLLKNRTRSLLLGSAIAGVTTLLVVLLSLISGIERTMVDNATALMTGHVNVAGFYKISQSSSSPMITGYQALYDIARKEVPEAVRMIDRVKSWGKLISDAGSVHVPMWGVHPDQEREILWRLPVAEGKAEEIGKPGTVTIFVSQAKKLKVKVGDTVTVSMPTYRNMSNTLDVRVAVILQDLGMMSQFTSFLNADDTRNIYQMSETATGAIMIFLKDLSQVSKVEERLRKAYADKGYRILEKDPTPFWMKFDRISGESWTGQKLDITNWRDEMSFVKWVLDLFHAITYLMTFVLLIIVVLGLMNALWMSIRERTSEVGTLRAIGLQRRQVMLMFMIESLVLSMTATLAGIGVGVLIASLLNALHIPVTSEAFQMFLMSNNLGFTVRPGELIFTFVLITLFLTVGALWPAYKAGRMKPINAINQID